ncbi:thermonuclease family protein [Pedobacter aquatilis]|uniref:thermonuclease family protein n=1 Tax=Pedobacter aquatilis TaxID=351343 RepID=UPI002930CF0A|nr:thermonuclease family protein [Pedobacter aquatilis]
MVKLGMAWHFKKYSSDSVYAKLENIARKKKVSLWQDSTAVAPWDWRGKKRALAK